MTQQIINNGTVAGDHTGEDLNSAFTKVNANYSELYAAAVGTASVGPNLAAVNQTASNTAGAAVTITAASGLGTGAGGAVNITSGAAPVGGNSGAINIVQGTTGSGGLGAINIGTLSGVGGTGSSINLMAGTATMFAANSDKLLFSTGFYDVIINSTPAANVWFEALGGASTSVLTCHFTATFAGSPYALEFYIPPAANTTAYWGYSGEAQPCVNVSWQMDSSTHSGAGLATVAIFGNNTGGLTASPYAGAQFGADLYCNNLDFMPRCDFTLNVQAPSAGFSITIAQYTQTLKLRPAGAINGTNTITMPQNPQNGQIVRISATQNINVASGTLTVSANGTPVGWSVIGAPATLSATTPVSFIADTTNKEWSRIAA